MWRLRLTFVFDIYVWHLCLTFIFDICIWHLLLTFTFVICVWHLCLTFIFDIYIWHLYAVENVPSIHMIQFRLNHVGLLTIRVDICIWNLYLTFCHLYLEFVFEFYIWHLHLTFIFDIYIRHLWCLIFRRLHLTFSFEEQHDRCVPKIGFWVFFFWNFALRLISV